MGLSSKHTANVRRARSGTSRESGFALIVVLLVLLALLVLATPLLLSARGADQASSRLADRTDARIALDTASRHARAVLADTYGSIDADRTPFFDGLDEVRVDNTFPSDFLDARDTGGAMWSVDSTDVAGLIDLDSASPQVLANMMGLTSRLGVVLEAGAKEIPFAPNPNFEPQGFLWIEGELVLVKKVEDSVAVDFTRGVFGPNDGGEWRGGPTPAVSHGIGAPVLDQRALAPALWRCMSATEEPRTWDSIERLPECADFALAAAMDPAGAGVMRDTLLRPLRDLGTAHGGVRAGPRWQRAARLTSEIEGGLDGKLRVDTIRWLNSGSTVRVRDGESSELALVQSVSATGEVVLDRVLRNTYSAYDSVVDVLVRRPVNLNTAPREVLVALFLNLQVARQNSRVTSGEADDLADLVVESRPFTGFQDFLERVVLPAAGIAALPGDAPVVPDRLRSGEAFLDKMDAVAVFANGLNANDGSLAWSTMPYSFTTRDVYALELRAAMNAESGVMRYAVVRDEVSVIAPQRELIQLWARQEDFDEELRLGLDAPWWLTGPEATSQWDGGAVPPSRLWPMLGTFEGRTYLPGVSDDSPYATRDTPPTPERTFPSRDETTWAALMPMRLAETDRLKGRVEHFDHETRDVEGRYLPDEVITKRADDDMVRWNDTDAPFLRSSALSMWIRPRDVSAGRYLDVGGTLPDRDRVTLEIDGADLVLRVLDGFGDHRDTTFTERGELRYSLSESPGLPIDIWSHVEVAVHGNRPSQMHMLVNGLAHGVRTPGLSRLSGTLSQGAGIVPVESTDGFPEHCVVRIGNELIEVTVAGGSMSAQRTETGPNAGFGGRLAREIVVHNTEDGGSPPLNLATLSTDHAAGTPVEVFGYSLPLSTDVPTGEARLTRDIGKFRVSRLVGVSGGSPALGDSIQIGLFGFEAGMGMAGANSSVNGLILKCADDGFVPDPATPPEEFMTAFNQDGGYAAIVQIGWSFGNGEILDAAGSPLGGIEVIRYSGWAGNTLTIADRGVGQALLPNLGELNQGQTRLIGGQRSFISKWRPGMTPVDDPIPIEEKMEWAAYVIPISFPVPGASDVRGFLTAKKGDSKFAQVTHVSDAELTEWVRYDHFDTAGGHLVRDDPDALITGLYNVLTRSLPLDAGNPPPPPDDDDLLGDVLRDLLGDAVHEFVAFEPNALEPALEPTLEPTLPEPPPAATAQTYAPTQWDPRLGENENVAADFPITRSVETWFQFRAVFGTWSHTHPTGTLVHPVFEVQERGDTGGVPGRLDAVFLVGSDPTHPGWPLVVHRAHRPAPEHATRSWRLQGGTGMKPIPVVPRDEYVEYDAYLRNRTYVAFQTRSPENVLAGSAVPNAADAVIESRLIARLVCFPSGERPRSVTNVQIGGGADGAVVPSALIDEVAFGNARFGEAASLDAEAMSGASLILDADVDESASVLQVRPRAVQIARGTVGSQTSFLSTLPADGGLLRIGDEILVYSSYDADTGVMQLASSGRGVLGTKAGPHEMFDPVLFLEQRVASTLTAGVGAGDSSLAIASTELFPPQGLVLVGSELIYYTRMRGSALEMPRASTTPGAMDQRGEGLFRGRFGTQPAGHGAGDAVILFPIRYPDLWSRKSDAPELAYFGFANDQPAAFWNSVYFKKQDSDSARIGVLVRSDASVPWDADPDKDPRITLLWQGDVEGRAVPIGRQSDRLDARAFVEYTTGAFDLTSGAAHGWRQTPRLSTFGVFYTAPNITLRSVER